MTQAREKRSSWFWVELTSELDEGAVMYCVRIFIFLFRTKFKKDQLDDNNFRQGYGNYFKSAILKPTYHSYAQSSFSTISFSRHTDNGIWQTPHSLRFYKHGSPFVLTLSWANIHKQKLTKVLEKLSAARKPELTLRKTLDEDILFMIIFFFFSQTSLTFKFNLVLIV